MFYENKDSFKNYNFFTVGRDIYQIGSLSHSLNTEVNGYQPLPDFPLEKPDPSVRNVEVFDKIVIKSVFSNFDFFQRLSKVCLLLLSLKKHSF